MADPLFAAFFEPAAFDLVRAMGAECLAQYRILLVTAVMLARRHSYSPLELFSAKLDTIFTEVLRRRFPSKTAN